MLEKASDEVLGREEQREQAEFNPTKGKYGNGKNQEKTSAKGAMNNNNNSGE